jgi:putative membrane protein
VSGEDARGARDPAAHRLHPLTVLLELGRVLGRVAWAFVLVVVVGSLGGRRADPAPLLLLLAGSGVLVALARYLSLRYWLEEERLVIRSGLLDRQVRTIPLDKIQNVELRQNAVHQLAGVVDFRIETAAGPEAEAHLAVLGRDEAERLKAALLGGRGQAGASVEEAPAPQVLWQAGLGRLLILGATSNRAGAILGAVAAALFFLGRELPGHLETLQRWLAAFVGTISPLTAAVVLLATTLLVGWLLSIALTVVGYHGFQLARDADGRLRRRYGLVSRVETVVAPARIQILRVESSWLRRRLGFWEVAAHTAGSAREGRGAGEALLAPLLRRDEIAGLCRPLLAGLDLESVPWRAVSRAALRRGFVRLFALALVLAGAASALVGPWAWAGLAPGALVAWWLAARRYRVLAHARVAGHLLSRSGLLRRRLTIVPESKVQWLGVTESPPQRRYRIATLTVATAAGAARVVDLDRAEALSLQRQLTAAASAAGAWLPDAV